MYESSWLECLVADEDLQRANIKELDRITSPVDDDQPKHGKVVLSKNFTHKMLLNTTFINLAEHGSLKAK